MKVNGSGFSVTGRHVVVVGAARSGVAAAELLIGRGARVTVSDIRPGFPDAAKLESMGVRLELGGHTETTFAGADLIVVSPGVPTDQPVFDLPRRRGIEVIGEIELASRWLRGRVIAITGTKGKSTTTTVIGRMLSAAGRTVVVGGNIGVPLSAQVEASTPDTVHVVEVSSFQLETTTSFHPWVAVWLNLAADHLDRHPDLRTYAEAKSRIVAHQGIEDWAVINADDPVVVSHSASTKAGIVPFSPSGRIEEGFVIEEGWIVRRELILGPAPDRHITTRLRRLVPVSAIEMAGRHMQANVLAAVAVSCLLNVPPAAMIEGLRGFRGLEHVMEPVGEWNGVRFVNDSKATNVDAATRSIESFATGVVAIIGGRFKGGDMRDLREVLRVHGRGVVAIGEAAPKVREALADVMPIVDAASMSEAVMRAYAMAAPDGVVLLAPACSSFDWFSDYAERGRVFKEEVARLRERRV